jgi:hypothetical protein
VWMEGEWSWLRILSHWGHGINRAELSHLSPLRPLCAWSNWRPAVQIRQEKTFTRPAELFINLFSVNYYKFIYLFVLKDLKKIISSAALRATATHATDFETLQ